MTTQKCPDTRRAHQREAEPDLVGDQTIVRHGRMANEFEAFLDGRWSRISYSARTADDLRRFADEEEARADQMLRNARKARLVADFLAEEEARRAAEEANKAERTRRHAVIMRRARKHRWCESCLQGSTHVCGKSPGGCKGGHCSDPSHKVTIIHSPIRGVQGVQD